MGQHGHLAFCKVQQCTDTERMERTWPYKGSLVLLCRLYNSLRSVKTGNYGVFSRWGPHCKTSYGDSTTEDEERVS